MSNPTAIPQDLDTCAREPIHIPGSIQPHGFLFVLSSADLTILAASENAAEALGTRPTDLIGKAISEFLVPTTMTSLETAVNSYLAEVGSLNVRFREWPDSREWECTVHSEDTAIILELRPRIDSENVETLLCSLPRAVDRIRKADSAEHALETLAREIRRLTQFDRVMIYHFDSSWNGEVIAEDKSAEADSYRGHAFPEADIPAQARELYKRNSIRLIPDASYKPSPIIPPTLSSTGQPIDLGAVMLRSVSPVHLRYLANMGVAASLSISIVRDDQLWGLVACHHPTPRTIANAVLQACEVLVLAGAWYLGAQDRSAAANCVETVHRIERELSMQSDVEHDYRARLKLIAPALLELTGSQGLAICDGQTVWSAGRVPTVQQILSAVRWLPNYGTETLITNRLSSLFPLAESHIDVASGLAAKRLPSGWLIWFRSEWPHTIAWAGNASDVMLAKSAPGPILPRKSFATWRQEVRGTSHPWSAREVFAVEEVQSLVLRLIAHDQMRLLRASQQALDTKSRQLRNIADNLPALIISRDLEQRYRFMNRTAEEWLGFGLEAIQGKTTREAAISEQALHSIWRSGEQETPATGRRELTICCSDGKTRIIDLAHALDIDKNGEIKGEIVLAMDITERKTVEEQLRETQKFQAVGTLAGGIAHQLNNLLGVILSNVELLADVVKGNPTASECAGDALSAVRQGAQLIHGLLSFARRQPLRPERSNPGELLSRISTLLAPMFGERIDVHLHLAADVGAIRVDRAQFAVAITNLATNAQEAMPNGGNITIAARNVSEDDKRTAPEATTENDIVVEMTDTGLGIPREAMDHLFEPFFTVKPDGLGSGLGLSMVFGFIKQSGGHMSIDSAAGHGTTVRLYLPRCD